MQLFQRLGLSNAILISRNEVKCKFSISQTLTKSIWPHLNFRKSFKCPRIQNLFALVSRIATSIIRRHQWSCKDKSVEEITCKIGGLVFVLALIKSMSFPESQRCFCPCGIVTKAPPPPRRKRPWTKWRGFSCDRGRRWVWGLHYCHDHHLPVVELGTITPSLADGSESCGGAFLASRRSPVSWVTEECRKTNLSNRRSVARNDPSAAALLEGDTPCTPAVTIRLAYWKTLLWLDRNVKERGCEVATRVAELYSQRSSRSSFIKPHIVQAT